MEPHLQRTTSASLKLLSWSWLASMAWRSPEVSRHDASRSTQVGPKILVPFKAIHALLRETLLLLRLDDDSVLYDSPLNEEGLAQARELNDLIENYRGEHLGDVQAMRDPSKSVVCSSNLRRAAQTILLGLKNRLDSSDEKIQCLTSLQEISTNVDTLSITPPHKAPRHLGTGVPQRLAHADR